MVQNPSQARTIPAAEQPTCIVITEGNIAYGMVQTASNVLSDRSTDDAFIVTEQNTAYGTAQNLGTAAQPLASFDQQIEKSLTAGEGVYEAIPEPDESMYDYPKFEFISERDSYDNPPQPPAGKLPLQQRAAEDN